MDPKTLRYYSENAEAVFKRYDSSGGGIEKHFTEAFPDKGRILDIGAGSGRDLLRLLHEGHEAYGIEPCAELRELTVHKYPKLASRMLRGRLPDDLELIKKSLPHPFDGVVCSAVLMHIPREHIFDSVFAVRGILKPSGRVLISIPGSRPDIDEHQRDPYGRLFTGITAGYLELLFERIGFRLIRKWLDSDSLNREKTSWITLLFELTDSHVVRPIDQIEGVLNRDRKVATYKLALFRALCEIAMTEFQKVRWLPDGRVGIPVSAVVDKWLVYYWPLFEAASFIPQIQGEHPECRKPVAFRKHLMELIDVYRKCGGLPAFISDYRSRRIPLPVKPLLKKLLISLQHTIIAGPVTYAGGSLRTGPLFSYDPPSRLVLVDVGVWKEFALMSHWILDALILRWAELTSRISRHTLQPSEVVDRLLITPLPERDVGHARQAFQTVPSIECVWSGTSIRKFDIDHVIPFSFWRSNDLWNLLPAKPSLNLQKKDRLPTHGLLSRRRDAVIHYWSILQGFNPKRFRFEAERLGGEGLFDMEGGWERPLFSSLVEAVEVTALQRGCGRWEP